MSYQFQTSLPAYLEIRPNIGRKQSQVLEAIANITEHTRRACNDREIAKYLNWPINTVTNRRGELLKLGRIYDAGVFKDLVTGRRTHFWKVAEQQLKIF